MWQLSGLSHGSFSPPSPAALNGDQITNPTPFTIISSSNNLLIQDTTNYTGLLPGSDVGAGFTPSETALMAAFTPDCLSLTMTLYFKVIDTVNDYRLFMKHWITGATGIMLTIVINNDTANPIVKYLHVRGRGR